MATDVLDAIGSAIAGGRCWGLELDERYRVLAVTVEPDPLRAPGTTGELQLLCFPVSTFLASLTRPERDGSGRRALLTFTQEELVAVSQRLGGTAIGSDVFGRPEPRPGTWGPRHSLEGRSSAADGVRRTLTLELVDEDDTQLRVFARFDDVELRDRDGALVLGTGGANSTGDRGREGGQDGDQEPPLGPLQF